MVQGLAVKVMVVSVDEVCKADGTSAKVVSVCMLLVLLYL